MVCVYVRVIVSVQVYVCVYCKWCHTHHVISITAGSVLKELQKMNV